MKKFSLAAMVLAIMLVATSAMAHDVRVPVLIEVVKCDHKVIKTVTYERVNDHGSYDVSDIYYFFYEGGVVDCNCKPKWLRHEVISRNLSQTEFDDLFKGSDDLFNDYKEIKASDGSVVVIDHAVYRDMGNKSYIAEQQ